MTARVHRATTWPLLRKDLTEMAAQPRAYWLRMLCVAVLYTLFLFLLPGEHAYSYGGGAGGRIFQNLNFQLAICLTVCAPAAVASAISGEKERNAFGLLLVTDLRPRELLVVAPLVTLLVVLGVYPKPALDVINPAVEHTMTAINQTDPAPTVTAGATR